MKYLWGIFRRDMRHATSNVIALIVSMGLVIVPALYAWFNIAASWDPYGNTKALKVAVANVDSGYKSELIPVRINVGETVLSALRANHQLDWQFVDSAKAVDGVKSGKYYAAIVIPKSFSADMMTLFSPTVKHATLKYYLNEKINPIAPHITDEGASTVANTIDKTFAKTMAQVGLDLAANMLQYSQSPQMTQYMTNLTSNIDGMVSTIAGAQAQVNAYSTLLGSADSVITSTDKLLASTRKAGKQARKTLKQSESSTSTLTDACTNVTDAVNQALQQAVSALDDIADKVDTAFDQLDKDATGAAKTLQDLFIAGIKQCERIRQLHRAAGEDAFGSRRIAGRRLETGLAERHRQADRGIAGRTTGYAGSGYGARRRLETGCRRQRRHSAGSTADPQPDHDGKTVDQYRAKRL